MTAFTALDYSTRDHVATVTLNRPDRRNAVDRTLARELRQALEGVAADDDIRAVVLRGAQGTFCAGADVSQFGETLTEEEVEAYLLEYYHPIIKALVTMKKPVIAEIAGAAAGAGMSIALACDLRIFGANAALHPAFSNIGLVPDAGATWFLVRHMGYSRAFAFLAAGKPMPARRCFEVGLANRVVEPDVLASEANAWAIELAERPTLALGLTKGLAHHAVTSTLFETFEREAALQATAIASDDHHEGVQAFRDKRDPKFTGC